MKTRFRPDGNEIVIDGSKTFITNGDVCDVLVLFGKWSELGNGREAISIAVVEKGTPGFEVQRTEKKMGMRASSTAALTFNNCRIPRTNLLGEPGEGLKMLFHFLNKSRPSVAAHALGIARAALQDATDYINERTQSGRKIVEFQGIQFMLADMATDLAMCERWLWHVAQRIEAGETDIAQESSMLKMRASDLAMRICRTCIEARLSYRASASSRLSEYSGQALLRRTAEERWRFR